MAQWPHYYILFKLQVYSLNVTLLGHTNVKEGPGKGVTLS